MIKSLVDWEPYRPFTVGFDSLWDRLNTLELDVPNYPPYNIRKIDDLKFTIELALAGFGKKDDIVHRGISHRAFTRTFALADDVVVNDAKFENGLLSIELEKIVPEEKRPKEIKIS